MFICPLIQCTLYGCALSISLDDGNMLTTIMDFQHLQKCMGDAWTWSANLGLHLNPKMCAHPCKGATFSTPLYLVPNDEDPAIVKALASPTNAHSPGSFMELLTRAIVSLNSISEHSPLPRLQSLP